MPDVFDQLHAANGGAAPQGDIFDQLHQQSSQQPSSASSPSPQTRQPSVPSGAPMSLSGFIGNVASSAGNFASGLWDATKLAAGAGETIADMSTGGLTRYIREKTGLPVVLPQEQQFDDVAGQVVYHPIDTASAVGQFLKQRYGSWDKAKQTAYQDPAGFAADLSTVLGGGATALKLASKVGEVAKLGRTADVLSDLGNVASKASQATNPLNIPGNVARTVAGNPMTAAAKSLYQGALKPSLANGAEENAAITETGLQHGVALNKNAPAKTRAIADAQQAETNATIGDSNAQVDPRKVVRSARSNFKSDLTDAANPGSAPTTFEANMQDYLGKHTALNIPDDIVQTVGEPGAAKPSLDDPHGIPTTPANRGLAQAEPGGKVHFWQKNPDANVLGIDNAGIDTTDPRNPFRGLANPGPGSYAALQLLGPQEFTRLKNSGALLRQFVTKQFPAFDWSQYSNRTQLLDGLGGALARENGYDAIALNDPLEVREGEYAGLTPEAMSPAKRPTPAPQPYPIADAQTEKIATYKKAANAYGKDEGIGPEQLATKALGYGLKTAMEQFIPELANMNAKEANAIGLDTAVQNFAAREANSGRLMRFLRPDFASAAVAGGIGATEHSLPMAFGAHLLTKALEDPGIQSRIAISLYRSANPASTPFIRQIMTPAERIAEVQQHIQAVAPQPAAPQQQQPAAPQPAPAVSQQPQQSGPFGLPMPQQAVQTAQAKAQGFTNNLEALGHHIHATRQAAQKGPLPPQ